MADDDNPDEWLFKQVTKGENFGPAEEIMIVAFAMVLLGVICLCLGPPGWAALFLAEWLGGHRICKAWKQLTKK